MTFDEWKILVKGLKSAYTSSFFLPDADAVKVWYQLLKDIPYKALNDAVMYWIQTQRKEPTIADLRAIVSETRETIEDWSEAWEDVKAAISHYGYYQADEALNSLSYLTREAAKRFGWSALCMMETDNENVNRAQFRDIYNAIKTRRVQQSQIAPQLAARISGNLLESAT